MSAPLRAQKRLVLLMTGLDEEGADSVAVWWMGVLGEPRAGWIFPSRRAFDDPVIASRLLAAAADGLLVAWDPDGCRALLDRLAATAGRPPGPPRPILHIDHVVAEVAKHSTIAASREIAVSGRCPVVDRVLATAALLEACARTWRELDHCGCRAAGRQCADPRPHAPEPRPAEE